MKLLSNPNNLSKYLVTPNSAKFVINKTTAFFVEVIILIIGIYFKIIFLHSITIINVSVEAELS